MNGTQIMADDNSSMKVDFLKANTFLEEVHTFMTFKVATHITRYWFPIMVPIGLIGNTLSFLVMIKPNNRKKSTCIYMAAISINDNLMMFMALRNWFITELLVHHRDLTQCKIGAFVGLLLLQNSTFQVVAMTDNILQ